MKVSPTRIYVIGSISAQQLNLRGTLFSSALITNNMEQKSTTEARLIAKHLWLNLEATFFILGQTPMTGIIYNRICTHG